MSVDAVLSRISEIQGQIDALRTGSVDTTSSAGSASTEASTAFAPSTLSSHLRVPSVETCSVTISGRPITNSSSSRWRSSLAMLVISAKDWTPRW